MNSHYLKSPLESLGWNAFFQHQLPQNTPLIYKLGRVISENKTNYVIQNDNGEALAEASGRLLFTADNDWSLLPKVGDWVLLTSYDEGRAIIHEVLKRRTILARTSAGKSLDAQIIATNLDRVFIVQSLDNNFNLRRLERFLTMTDGTGIEPIIVLNKADTCAVVQERLEQVRKEIPFVKAIAISAFENEGLVALKALIEPGMTVAFIGSSGVGKSTLINELIGTNRQTTGAVRQEDSKGRHTTTRRELIVLDSGGIVIDTPGMRELQLPYNGETDSRTAFADITAASLRCRFRTCTHRGEKGCAVQAEIETGRISEDHYRSYQKLLREHEYLAAKLSKEGEQSRKKEIKRTQRAFNQIIRNRR